MKKYITPVVFIATILWAVAAIVVISKKQPQNSCKVLQASYDSLLNQHDSLKDVCYPAELELNRYKIGYEIFMRRNPKAAQQYGTIVSNEVE